MSYLDAAFVLAVTGVAMIHPVFPPIVAAAFFLFTWWENDRRVVRDADDPRDGGG